MAAKFNEGRYWVRVQRQGMGKSEQKGTPFFQLEVLVVGAVDPKNPEGDLLGVDQAERRITMYLTEKTAEFTMEKLEAIGFDRPSLKFLDPTTPDFCNFTGKEFEAWCAHEQGTGTNQGKVFEKWSISTPRDSKPLEAPAPSELSKLDALFGKQLSKFKKASAPQRSAPVEKAAGMGVPESQRQAAMAAQKEGDEIPF
jgi:hypothetical protein